MTLLPFCCLAACIYGLVRMIAGRNADYKHTPVATAPVGGPPPYPGATTNGYVYPPHHTGYAYPVQGRTGYGAGALAGAGGLGLLGGAMLGSAMADGGDFGGGGDFAPAVDFPAGV